MNRAVSEPRTTNGFDTVRGESRGPPRTAIAGEPVPVNRFRSLSYNNPCARFTDVTVLLNNIAIVIGPTPPGTGVIHPATPLTGP
jgi:hypothetical protein